MPFTTQFLACSDYFRNSGLKKNHWNKDPPWGQSKIGGQKIVLQVPTHHSLAPSPFTPRASLCSWEPHLERREEKALAKKSTLQTPGSVTGALIPKTPPQGRNPNLPHGEICPASPRSALISGADPGPAPAQS